MSRHLGQLIIAFLTLALLPPVARATVSCPTFVTKDGPDRDQQPDKVSTVRVGLRCVLRQDVVGLLEPLILTHPVEIDCQGHKITPSFAGVSTINPPPAGFPADQLYGYQPTQPPVAVVLDDAVGVEVRDCVIEGFDFGFLVMRNKLPQGLRHHPLIRFLLANRIRNNRVDAKYVGAFILASDDNIVEANTFSQSESSTGLVRVLRDSDFNVIRDNLLLGGSKPFAPGPIMPGSNQRGTASNLRFGVITTVTNNQALFNLQLDGRLYQFPLNDDVGPDGNVIDGNRVDLPARDISIFTSVGIQAGGASRDTVVRGNTVVRAQVGIGAGGESGVGITTPGRCSQDAGRFCATTADCKIAGIDDGRPDKGTCAGVTVQTYDDRFLSRNTLVEYNEIGDASLPQSIQLTGLAQVGPTSLARYNRVFSEDVAWRVSGPALMGSTITRNTISGGKVDIHLGPATAQGQTATVFSAAVSLNDFGPGPVPVRTSDGYAFPTELSVGDDGRPCAPGSQDCRGNHWGLACSDGDGGFDPTTVRNETGSVNERVRDSHAYGAPVAYVPDENLPLTCE